MQEKNDPLCSCKRNWLDFGTTYIITTCEGANSYPKNVPKNWNIPIPNNDPIVGEFTGNIKIENIIVSESKLVLKVLNILNI